MGIPCGNCNAMTELPQRNPRGGPELCPTCWSRAHADAEVERREGFGVDSSGSSDDDDDSGWDIVDDLLE